MALVADLVRSDVTPGAKAATLIAWDRVLGLDLNRAARERPLPAGASALLAARQKARDARDFPRSDELRDQLASLGVTVIDTAEGQRIKP